MPDSGATISRAQWVGFFALCWLGASAWLVDQAWPSAAPMAERQGLHDLVIAVVLCGVGWKSLRGSLRLSRWKPLSVASVCLLSLPATAAEAALSGISEGTIAASFALIPAAVVVLVSNFNFGREEAMDANRSLAPALIGLAGILLLLPVATLGSWRQAGFAVLAVFGVLAAALASVWMYRLLRDFTAIDAAAVCCLANAAFLLLVSLLARADGGSRWGAGWSWNALAIEILRAVCFDLPQIVLLMWLMREIAPARFAARFLVVPLLTAIEGYTLLRPEITLRAVGGAALVILGVWRLMTSSQRDEEPGLMLR